jgi:hypothetical protein
MELIRIVFEVSRGRKFTNSRGCGVVVVFWGIVMNQLNDLWSIEGSEF